MARWSEKELKELEDPDTWDETQAQVHQPPKHRRAVVSVAFPRDDFERVADAANASGMKLSEFIRHAALQMSEPGGQIQTRASISDSLGGFRRVDVTIAPRSTFHETKRAATSG
ncbi:MAG TPA: hypothetical protein VMM78_17765 [Thermomicrobiales bacterium]|nr:hypothetical protein [Thermomicrobiales bacterium]